RGIRVHFSKFSGNRSKYISAYDPCTKMIDWCTPYDKFFIITNRKKAAYVDLSRLGMVNTRSAFKAARLSNERMVGIVPASGVPYPELIDFERYHKGYTVKMKYDELWGERLSAEERSRRYTIKAIKYMIEKQKYNSVPEELIAMYDPNTLKDEDYAEIGMIKDAESGKVYYPKVKEDDELVELISREELRKSLGYVV